MDVHEWLGMPIADSTGGRYARLEELFVGKESGAPEFGIISLGPNGGERVAIPLQGTHLADDRLISPVDPERVLTAPRVRGPVEEIPAEAGRRILEFFDFEAPAAPAVAEGPAPVDPTPTPPLPTAPEAPEPVPTREDDAVEVTLSEEKLQVDVRNRPTERVRLRKEVVTEEVTVTVTVRREELVIDRVPVTDDGSAGPEVFDAPVGPGGDLDIVLHAEEPVVTKRVVPVERVRLHRDVITEQQTVTDTVRKERVDVDELPAT